MAVLYRTAIFYAAGLMWKEFPEYFKLDKITMFHYILSVLTVFNDRCLSFYLLLCCKGR